MADNRHKRLSQISQKNYSMDRFTDLKTNTSFSAGSLTTNCHNNYAEPQYESRDRLANKELEATRARVSQMEKVFQMLSYKSTDF